MTTNELLQLQYPLYLASQSPRRRALMQHCGFDFQVVKQHFVEADDPGDLPPDKYVEGHAVGKAVAGSINVAAESVVIGCDTTVALDGRVMNKPTSSTEAFDMLSTLSNRTHVVYSGIAVVVPAFGIELVDHRSTEVTFRKLEPAEINWYVSGGSPMDKAGAYGIQDDAGALFVSNISGCYYTVVGLPLERLYKLLIRTSTLLKELRQSA